jgi:hypothetical protein
LLNGTKSFNDRALKVRLEAHDSLTTYTSALCAN